MAADSLDALKTRYLGRSLESIPTPAAILDLAKVEVNCQRMLDAIDRLGVLWRAHVKTHKTVQLTRLQVGDHRVAPVNLVVSTLVEAENLVPLCLEYKSKGRECSILYSFPLYSSCIDRLSDVSSRLGPRGLSVMIDHPAQLHLLPTLQSQSGHPPLVFLKIDMGYARAGVRPDTPAYDALISGLLVSEAAGNCVLHGLYCHAGHSYETRAEWAAMADLAAELLALQKVAAHVQAAAATHRQLVLSVGATPTATTLQHPELGGEGSEHLNDREKEDDPATPSRLRTLLDELRSSGCDVEVHAGVYPMLDLQQLATHARDGHLLSASHLALTVLAEVTSMYPGRGANDTTEALVNAGCLALGREPVKDKGVPPGRDYGGWGIVAPWQVENVVPGPDFPRVHGGWQVGRISQEHGILVWKGGRGEEEVPLQVGQRVRIWPNHACIAGAGFDFYLVVDSRLEGREDEIVDVWPRWRGW